MNIELLYWPDSLDKIREVGIDVVEMRMLEEKTTALDISFGKEIMKAGIDISSNRSYVTHVRSTIEIRMGIFVCYKKKGIFMILASGIHCRNDTWVVVSSRVVVTIWKRIPHRST